MNPFRSVRSLLVADVLADLIGVEPDRRDGIASGPEVFAAEVLLSTTQAGNGYGALPFQKPNHRNDWVLGGMARHMCTSSGFKCPSIIWHSFCRAKAWKISPSCRRTLPNS